MTIRTGRGAGKTASMAIMLLSLLWNVKYLPLNNSHLQLAVLALLNLQLEIPTNCCSKHPQIIHSGAKQTNKHLLQVTDKCKIPGNLSFAE